MKWGHKVSVGRNKQEEVTRAEYNEVAGVETPPMPEIPACGLHIWEWWWELNARRAPGFDSLAPLSYAEILAWKTLTGRIIPPEEVAMLIHMDNAWLVAIAKEKQGKRDREKEEAERKKQQGGK